MEVLTDSLCAKNLASVFSPQPSPATTPGGFTDGLSPFPLTPLSNLQETSAEPSVQDTCRVLDKISKLLEFLVGSTDKFVRPADQSITNKSMVITKEVGELYALIFNERNSKDPTLSTSTILDNFMGAESLTNTIEADRLAISEEFIRVKTGIRRDIGKSERRQMMCAFFSDPKAFFANYMKKIEEAGKHQVHTCP